MLEYQPEVMQILSNSRFTEGLSNDHLLCLSRASRLLTVSAGAKLFEEGAIENEIFVVASGYIQLSMRVPGRRDVTFLTTGPGDLVGWSGLISDGRMTATAMATEESKLVAISTERLRDLSACDNGFGFVLMKRVAQVLSQRLLSTRLQLLDLFNDEK